MMGIVSDLRRLAPTVRQVLNGYNADIVVRAADRIEALEQELADSATVTPAPLPENMAFNFDALDTPADEVTESTVDES